MTKPILGIILSIILCLITIIVVITSVVGPYIDSQIGSIREEAKEDFSSKDVDLYRYYNSQESTTRFPEFYYYREIDILLAVEQTKDGNVTLSDFTGATQISPMSYYALYHVYGSNNTDFFYVYDDHGDKIYLNNSMLGVVYPFENDVVVMGSTVLKYKLDLIN